jgi:hypothetical protein
VFKHEGEVIQLIRVTWRSLPVDMKRTEVKREEGYVNVKVETGMSHMCVCVCLSVCML